MAKQTKKNKVNKDFGTSSFANEMSSSFKPFEDNLKNPKPLESGPVAKQSIPAEKLKQVQEEPVKKQEVTQPQTKGKTTIGELIDKTPWLKKAATWTTAGFIVLILGPAIWNLLTNIVGRLV